MLISYYWEKSHSFIWILLKIVSEVAAVRSNIICKQSSAAQAVMSNPRCQPDPTCEDPLAELFKTRILCVPGVRKKHKDEAVAS